MHKIIKYRWVIFVVWIAAVVLSVVYSPDLNKVLRDKGQQFLSDDNPSVKADNILKKMNKTSGNADLMVFNSKNKLTSSDMDNIKAGVNIIKDNEKDLGVSDMLDPFNIPDIKSNLVSKDEKTVMVTFRLNKNGREVSDIQNEFKNKLKDVHINYYLTGEDFINDDYIKVISNGVDKSAILTIIFILVILIIMFRSFVTPIVSLLAVGISYIVSMAIVGQFVYRFNYPVSSLTQMVLVLILFGIGTDYNILLFNRFKDEMSKSNSIDEAIIKTYKTAGKTIVFSIATVFIAFLSLTLAKFGMYRSANCVAIGVIILLLEILTLTPFIMKTLGIKLFWPSKEVTNHKPSKFWGKATSFSVKKPALVSIIIILVLIPIVLFNVQKYSYDTINELSDSVGSVKGFNLVADSFGKGQALTTTVVLQNNKPMNNNADLSAIDNLTKQIRNVKGVKSVSSVTEPLSNPIDLLYIGKQTQQVTEGISKSRNGVDTINNGLTQINNNLNSVNLNDLSKVDALVAGTTQVQNGLTAITSGMNQVNTVISQGADGADKLNAGIVQAKNGLAQVVSYTQQLSAGVSQIHDKYNQLGASYAGIEKGADDLQSGISEIQEHIREIKNASSTLNDNSNELFNSFAALNNDSGFKTAITNDPYLKKAVDGIGQLNGGIGQLNGGITQLSTGVEGLNTGAQKLNNGVVEFKKNYDTVTSNLGDVTTNINNINAAQNQIVTGLSQLQDGSSALASGLRAGGNGQSEIIQNMSKLNSGLSQVKGGQVQLNDELKKFSSSIPELKDALGQSGNGLSSISSGLNQTNNYLDQLTNTQTFFLPSEQLNSDDFKKSLDMYMTDDRKITKLTVVLDADPYSTEAMNTAKNINDIIPNAINGTDLKNATYGVTGTSASDYDLNKIALSDLNTIKVIVLIAIFAVLVLVIRSPLISLYISIALMAAYYISSSLLNFIVFHIFKLDGISWNVPFFSFVMIVALGVDYSIFLMMRFKECKGISKNEAIIIASKNIGGIVMSAALILGGTFITMAPSGVKLLIQLAIAVVIGLAALSLLLLPIFVPSLIALPGWINNLMDKNKDDSFEDSKVS
ncbi:MMPL family transporter [Clostridium pasteurianum]|uniref:X-X-X-Leu-X-X-Gly heptad repeat-containing protein n=1 Tax=Clostridium pasteurianum BC1 TaxID=86416 RepID=R4K1B6_CLOPA|nr:MMPL family transporter [Clostridium pasteurianum]AGK95531.1 X-X-X-Leu-X-X-Gly heptad repeat-containing protein [Clostridium pasteurianum BC1]